MAAGFKARAQARVGQVLRGKWHLDRLIGVGGMAAVYAATHRNGKRGAVKLLHLELSMSPEATARFLREGYVANSVDHPGAVSVLDDDVCDDGAVYLVMEMLEGETLEQRRASHPGGRLDDSEVLLHADALLDILVAAHAKGVVHRDIKPDNVFLTKRGEIKVLDFGIARIRELQSQGNMTRTGSTMGTPAFMAPEQALGNWSSVDGRTDLWAVGATMFELCTGRTVHVADTFQKQLLAAMTKPAPALASVAPGAHPSLCAIVDRALAFESANRWPDAATMQRAVREASKRVTADAAAGRSSPDPTATLASARDPLAAVPRDPRAPEVGELTASPISSDAFSTRPQGSPSAQKRKSRGIAVAASISVVVIGTVAFVALRGHGAPAPGEPPEREIPAPAVEATPAPIQVVPNGAPDDVDAGTEPAAPTASASASASATAGPDRTARPGPAVRGAPAETARPPVRPPATPKTSDPFNKF